MTKLNEKSVKQIVSDIASGRNLVEIANSFGISEISVGNIARGSTHATITGLIGEQSGVKYLRNNKEKFVIAKPTPSKKEVKSTVEPTTTPAQVVTETKVERKPRQNKQKQKTSSDPVVSVSLEDRADNIITETTKIVSDIENTIFTMDASILFKLQEIEDLRNKISALETKKSQWETIIESMTSPTA